MLNSTNISPRCPRGEQMMRAQLKRLLAHAQRPNTTIQALPFGVGVHRAAHGAFVVLACPDDFEDTAFVYVESHPGDIYLEKEHDVDVSKRMFDALVALCMTAEQSMVFVTKFLLDH